MVGGLPPTVDGGATSADIRNSRRRVLGGFEPEIHISHRGVVDFTITYDKSMRTITVGRTHDVFPSYQLWIGGTVRYDYQQGHIGELFGTRDVGGDR